MPKIQRRASLSSSTFDSSIVPDTTLPPLLQRLFAARNITSVEQLDYRLQKLLRPELLSGFEQAISCLKLALEQQQRILIIGDFDADGATSSALAVLALHAMGLQHIHFLVPNRFEYGYGLTPEIVDAAKDYQPDLIITVDNGIASVAGVERANQLDIPVIITDHHLPPEILPEAAAIVNPNQAGCAFPSKHLAGVGVIFYLLSGLRAALRESNWFTQQQIPEPNMAEYLDLVALGTVADVVPLDHNNRILVHQGLQRIRAGKTRPGILALLQVAGKDHRRISSQDCGFVLGPRLNAAGRLDDMSIGIQCLLADNSANAQALAAELDSLNRDRRAIEASMQKEALASLQHIQLAETELPWGLCLFDKNWHQGVVGILASRIKDQYHRPVIAFAEVDDNTIKGSARSIAGLHIRDTLDAIATQHPEILQKFGGHAMAAGLTIDKNQLTAFQNAFDQCVRQQLTSTDLKEVIVTDGELAATELNLKAARLLRDAGPWGQHFPEPLFDGEFAIVNQRIVGEKHLKLTVSPKENSQNIIDAIAFNIDIDAWPDQHVEHIKLVYQLSVNEYRGIESAQLIVRYIEKIA